MGLNLLVHSRIILFLISFQILLCTTNGIQTHQEQHFKLSSTTTFSPKLQTAERFIRQLNLSLNHPFNQRANSGLSVEHPGHLVEWEFKLPELGDPGSTVEDLGHHAGYYRLPQTRDARMFYFFFESRNSKNDDPVVIWLQGGPGCGGELALFYENGPFLLAKNMSLIRNNFGWDKASNLIYVDQPVGTGFSYTSDTGDIPHDEGGVSNHLYYFLQAFFEAHPQYANNDFFITGESYGGHYIPALATRIHNGNKAKEGLHINLQGFAIGNGFTHPEIQYGAYPDYALAHRLITLADYERISNMIPACQQALKQCGTDGEDACLSAMGPCGSIYSAILDSAGNTNEYDIRKKCDRETDICFDFSHMETFLNNKTVKRALGVEDVDFTFASKEVSEALKMDVMRNLAADIPALLEDGIRMLVYAGEYDLICNWMGNYRWVEAMEWSGQKGFRRHHQVGFRVDGKIAAQLKGTSSLAFLLVHNAGHMVPMDQPKVALEMLKRWTQGTLLARADATDETSPVERWALGATSIVSFE